MGCRYWTEKNPVGQNGFRKKTRDFYPPNIFFYRKLEFQVETEKLLLNAFKKKNGQLISNETPSAVEREKKNIG